MTARKKKLKMDDAPVKLFRYLGRRFGDDLRDTFQELDPKTFEPFKKKAGNWKVGGGDSFIIGAAYSIRCTDSYTIWLGSAALADDDDATAPSEDDLTGWSLLDKDARNQKLKANATKRQEKKARGSYLWVIEALQPVYNDLNGWDRIAMIRVISNELRKGHERAAK